MDKNSKLVEKNSKPSSERELAAAKVVESTITLTHDLQLSDGHNRESHQVI